MKNEETLPTHDELIALYQSGQAVLDVNHINHREFIVGTNRYSVGYSSQRAATTKPHKDLIDAMARPYDVVGWVTYKVETA